MRWQSEDDNWWKMLGPRCGRPAYSPPRLYLQCRKRRPLVIPPRSAVDTGWPPHNPGKGPSAKLKSLSVSRCICQTPCHRSPRPREVSCGSSLTRCVLVPLLLAIWYYDNCSTYTPVRRGHCSVSPAQYVQPCYHFSVWQARLTRGLIINYLENSHPTERLRVTLHHMLTKRTEGGLKMDRMRFAFGLDQPMVHVVSAGSGFHRIEGAGTFFN
ncbi:uncharacterized protein C8Q71DRAFT_579821 [Rhodofomes roseus]|uniref:Uncharacterized protein n=1 Tax=Rhodofomes roseus TaxID=34475 RepID=A0ABQ8KGW0_9APHY|nr:uncharacterized protein C8Q71DRAFT_579821 [Rhodofomes roseus]KAH9836970.1 hypothetical protein C8Q71DRAFT_579821 [Rhodofomes roseus]